MVSGPTDGTFKNPRCLQYTSKEKHTQQIKKPPEGGFQSTLVGQFD
jgi:hypothetical protein